MSISQRIWKQAKVCWWNCEHQLAKTDILTPGQSQFESELELRWRNQLRFRSLAACSWPLTQPRKYSRNNDRAASRLFHSFYSSLRLSIEHPDFSYTHPHNGYHSRHTVNWCVYSPSNELLGNTYQPILNVGILYSPWMTFQKYGTSSSSPGPGSYITSNSQILTGTHYQSSIRRHNHKPQMNPIGICLTKWYLRCCKQSNVGQMGWRNLNEPRTW
jgi:hypothetical protein